MIELSITCPHCDLTSYNKADVELRYCAKCGYIDADQLAPTGVPGVSAKWRQPTPAMQLQLVVSCMEACIHLWRVGISTDQKLSEILDRNLNDIRELVPHLEEATWEKNNV